MTMATFKFDFAPSVEEGTEVTIDPAKQKRSSEKQGNAWNANDANALISELLHRSENASSKIILSKNNASNNKSSNNSNCASIGITENEEFANFNSHESISLTSSTTIICRTMDKLHYVIPKHTHYATTDLIPGVYEGGLKVWECSIDLCRFLASIISELSKTTSDDANPTTLCASMVDEDFISVQMAVKRCIESNGTTLELGCGHGLPGCLILREKIRRRLEKEPAFSVDDGDDASVVIFSDFNDFVLHRATIRNAQLNVCGIQYDDGVAVDKFRIEQALLERSIFVGGDWMGLSQMLASGILPLPGVSRHQHTKNIPLKSDVDDNRLDLILASETTYTPESCEDTAFFMLRHLKVDVGVGLVATKRFYFGVGGGTDLFAAACEKLSISDIGQFSHLRLCVRTAQSYDNGNANIRDLLEVRCRRK